MSEDLGNPNEPLEAVIIDANILQAEAEGGIEGLTQNTGERTYTILSMNDIDSVDFSQFITTNVDTARKNNDETKILLKFSGEVPSSIVSLNTITYTHEEIIAELQSSEWTPEDPVSE
jgi:hypothetical protein